MIPLIIVELIIYVVCLLLSWYWNLHDEEEAYSSLIVEMAIVIPILFIYWNWNLCQDIYEKHRNFDRFAAIEDRLT